MDADRFADDVADGHARVQRTKRVLEDHLRFATERFQAGAVELRDVLVLEPDFAGGRFDKPQQGAAQRRLAATRFTDEADGFAFVDGEGHAVHRAHPADGTLQHARADREVRFEVFDFEQAHVFSSHE